MLTRRLKPKQFKLSNKEITHIQGIVIEGLMKNREDIGKYRKLPVVIKNPSNVDNMRFIPHDYQDIKPLIDNLINFINDNIGKIDSILLAGLFHK